MSEISFYDICASLRANADALARELLPLGRHVAGASEWRASARNSPTGDTISVHVARDRKQGLCGFWNRSPEGGDILDLIQLVHGYSKPSAIRWAKQWLGIDDTKTLISARPLSRRGATNGRAVSSDEEEAAKKIAAADRLWRSSEPSLSPIARAYLSGRGLDTARINDDELRFHPGLAHPSAGAFPAIIARVANKANRLTGIWRIYLKMDGSGKAPVDTPKMGLGAVKGGAVRLGGVWPVIGVAEGIETALACGEIAKRAGKAVAPVWAALSTSGMRAFEPPPEVEHVRIYADNDAARFSRDGTFVPSPGLGAAEELRARLEARGLTVSIELPPLDCDWLDVLNAMKQERKAA